MAEYMDICLSSMNIDFVSVSFCCCCVAFAVAAAAVAD